MRLPHIPQMSTGTWVFASAVAVALIASPSIYAAATSVIAIGNPNGSTTALVTPTRQLQTTITSPVNIVHVSAPIPDTCTEIYSPPAGKAIVVTQITYDLGSGTPGTEYYALLGDENCVDSYDLADTVQAFETETRTYPTGMPMPNISVHGNMASATGILVTGYLIPATQLPPEAPQSRRRIKGMMFRSQ